jgi:hypothetical protein
MIQRTSCQGGVGWIRDELGWAAMEPTPGNYHIPAKTLAWIHAARRAGLKIDLVLSYGNPAYPDHYGTDAYAEAAGWLAGAGCVFPTNRLRSRVGLRPTRNAIPSPAPINKGRWSLFGKPNRGIRIATSANAVITLPLATNLATYSFTIYCRKADPDPVQALR